MLKKVLIADDDKTSRQMLRNILDGEYQVLEAASGTEALALLMQEPGAISALLLDLTLPDLDGFQILTQMQADGVLASIPVLACGGSCDEEAEVKALNLGAGDFIRKPYQPMVIHKRLALLIHFMETISLLNQSTRDKLTGLLNREAFFAQVEEHISQKEAGYYILSCLDIDNFKLINDQYGSAIGDSVLRHVAVTLNRCVDPVAGDSICGRISGDRFAILYPKSLSGSGELAALRRTLLQPDCKIPPMTIRTGRYLVDDLSLSANAIYDRASLAEESVRGRYDSHIAYYNDALRQRLLREQDIVNKMTPALAAGEFEVWFQPQYNHASGALVGAEALARWRQAESGQLLAPSEFIPIFERNGFIYELDRFIWERVCMLLRQWLDRGRSPLPISVNVSRYDIFRADLLEVLSGLLEKYRLPVGLLRLEITESAFAKSTEQIISVVQSLLTAGFTVEIDDFGSGYSSLNTLKDVPASILKLDMRFLEGQEHTQRGGNILESVVRMAKWLGMSVIAEGVETLAQADFLASIGCNYIQGYLYAKPMPVEHYEALAATAAKEERLLALETVETLDNNAFWDPASMDTLIFNSYVGGACIFEYHAGQVEMLRANRKYAQMLSGGALSVEEALRLSWREHFDAANRQMCLELFQQAIASREETTGVLELQHLPWGQEKLTLRVFLRMIASAGDRWLFYCINENITAQAEAEERLSFLNDTAHELLAQPDTDQGVERILWKLLSYFDGNRAYLIELNEEKQVCNNTYEVCRPGVPSEKQNLQNLPYSAAPYWFDAFADKGFINILDVNALEDARAEERKILLAQNIKSLIAVPMLRDGRLIGFLGIDDPRRRQAHVDRLDAIGDYIAVILTRRDLDRKLENSHRSLLGLMNDTPGGFVRLRVQADGSAAVEYANDHFCQLLSIDRQALPQLTAEDLLGRIHPEDRPAIDVALSEMVQTNRLSTRCRLRQAGDTWLWMLIFGRLVRENPDQAYLNIHYTEMPAENRLELQRQELIENLPCGAGIYELKDGHFTVVYQNRRYFELIGCNGGEQTNAPGLQPVHPEDRELIRQELLAAVAEDRDCACNLRIQHRDGDYRTFHLTANVEKPENGRVMVYATYTPISREELSFREMLPVALNAMMRSSTDISFVKDSDLHYICGSEAFADAAGLANADDLVGKTDQQLFGPERGRQYHNDDLKVIRSGASQVNMVMELPNGDGSVHYYNTSKYLLHDTQGRVIGLYFVGRDITETREAYARLRLLTDSIPGGLATYACSPRGIQVIYFNDGFCTMLGCTRAEYEQLSATSPVSTVFQEDLHLILEQLDELIQHNTPIDCTYRIHNMKDSGYKWINLRGVLSQMQGETAIVNVVLYDITTRVETEEKLRITEEETRLALSQMGKMILLYDIPSRTLTMPEAYARKHGIPAVLPDVPDGLPARGVIYGQDSSGFKDFYDAILRGEKSGTAEARLACVDGSWPWERAEFMTIFSNKGQPMRAVISVEDVSAQHEKAQEAAAMKDNERLLQLAASHSERIIYRYELASHTAYGSIADNAHRQLLPLGAELPESLISQNAIYPESVEDFRQFFADIDAGKPEGSTKLHIHNGEGGASWLDMRYSLMHSVEGKPRSAVISLLDITENHEKELAYGRYRQRIDDHVATDNGLIYLEADLTADITEKQGGPMLPADFPSVGRHRNELIDYIVNHFIVREERTKCHQFFSREHLITLFADGTRSISEDWAITFPDGKPGYICSDLQMVQDPYTGHVKVYTTLENVTEEKLAALQVQRLADIDGMTELYNKTKAEALIRQRLSENKDGSACVLLIADLDRLKFINDTYGHEMGDQAIRLMADALRSQFRKTDIIGRFGGDEFIVFLSGIENDRRLRTSISAFMQRLTAVHIGADKDVAVNASIGAARARQETSFETLFRQADRALYHVKRNGKNNFAIYTPDMEKKEYQYQSHAEPAAWQVSLFDKDELDRLLRAVSVLYPLVISSNLTQNSYYTMQYNHFTTTAVRDSGIFDQLIQDGVATFAQEDQASFLATFSRDALMAAFLRGEATVCHQGRQRGDDGVYRLIQTYVIFVQSADSGDVMAITLARELTVGQEPLDIPRPKA